MRRKSQEESVKKRDAKETRSRSRGQRVEIAGHATHAPVPNTSLCPEKIRTSILAAYRKDRVHSISGISFVKLM